MPVHKSTQQSGHEGLAGERYNELWFAEQAIEQGSTLLTLNRDDFVGLPVLRLLTLRA